MNSIYFLIYFNSLKSQLLVSLSSECAWFAALWFGGYNMTIVTLAAFVGSTIGVLLNYGFGYYISRWRESLPVYNEELYGRISRFFNRYLYAFLGIPPLFILELMPGLSIFVLVCGMFRVRPVKALSMIALSRALYYAYYLMQNAQIL